MAWMCARYPGSLPEHGGINDQDFVLITRMGYLDNVYRTVSRLRRMTGDQIHNLTGRERQLLKELHEEKVI